MKIFFVLFFLLILIKIFNKNDLIMENSQQNDPKPKVVKKRVLPTKDIDLGAVATLVSNMWLTNNWLLLLWLTSAQFRTIVTNFNANLTLRNRTGGTKKGVSKELELLNIEIDDALAYVKGYILEKFKKDRATSMYASFGIVHKNEKYMLPQDIDGRKEALATLLEAISANDFDSREYGRDYWREIKGRFDELAQQATALSGTISEKVGDNSQLRKEIQLALNSLIKAIQANYPHTWKEELRAWGFQKERY